jgi:hypothetical protein
MDSSHVGMTAVQKAGDSLLRTNDKLANFTALLTGGEIYW